MNRTDQSPLQSHGDEVKPTEDNSRVRLHVIVRRLTPADASPLSAILLASPTDYMRFFHPFAFDLATIRTQLERAQKDVYFGLDVVSDSRSSLAGFYMMRGLDEGYPNPMYGVFVSQAYANRGLARLTLDHAYAFCKLNGYEQLLLKVDPRNVHAKKLYESCGFQYLRDEPGSHDVVLCRKIHADPPEPR
jgi:ribosomal protein S18 acetylase RimI-like enzyme